MSHGRALAPAILGAVLAAAAHAAAAEPRTISVGAGKSSIVEYDLDLAPLVRYVGFDEPTDLTPLADGTILIADPRAGEILAMRRDGGFAWRKKIARAPSRVRPRRGGGFLVCTFDEVLALDAAREIEWRLTVANLKAAVELANGNVLVASNDRNGWLTELTPKGEVVWRSLPPGYNDAEGRWVDEDKRRYFSSVAALDVGSDGRILTTDFDQNELRVLGPTYVMLQSSYGLRHMVDTRFGPAGEIVAASPEDLSVAIEMPGRWRKRLESKQPPYCANLSPWGTVWVGFHWRPEAEVMNATAARQRAQVEDPWWRRALPLPSIVAATALLVAVLLCRGRRNEPANADVRSGRSDEGPVAARPRSALRIIAAIVGLLALAGGAYVAWLGIRDIRSTGFTSTQWLLAIGSLVGGVALRALNALAGSADSLSSFIEPPAPAAAPRADNRRRALVALSIASLAACLAVVLWLPQEQAAAIALWLAAQIWALAAAYPPVDAAATPGKSRLVERLLLAAIIVFAVATRFWEIGGYPDNNHHDHEIYGVTMLKTMAGAWKPFFIMDPYSGATYSRPWLAPAMAAIELFGAHYWVLRLTAAFWSVAMVWGAYLLGRQLFQSRVGLIAALLVSINHALLLYSRQPYVIESTAPFLLALASAAIALRRSSRFHWCLAGVLCGWSMLSVRQSTVYPFVGAALFAYLAIAHRRWLWRNRTGLAWLVLGAAVVYAPMLPGTLWDPNLVARLDATMALANPDGSIRWDLDLWGAQMGRSFGSLFYFGDNAAWQIGTGQPILLGIEACLFGIGLTYLLLTWRTPATFTVTATIAITIFLGSAVLHSPPTFYHYFVGMVFACFVTAVACDRVLALTDRWRRGWRVLPALAVAALLGIVARDHLGSAWASVSRPPPAADGRTAYRGHPMYVVGRFIREHPEWRHYIVRGPQDVSAASPILAFAIVDSDVSDITTELDGVLPVPPVDSAAGASFIVLASRAAERPVIDAVYPGARIETLDVEYPQLTTWVYLVDAQQVRTAYEARDGGASAAGVP